MLLEVWLKPGNIVSTPFAGGFKHKGIVSDRWLGGKPTVIANAKSTNGVAEVLWDAFAGIGPVFDEGYPGTLSPFEVLENARSMIGERYDVLESNCEHFVAKCHGLEPRSPQLVLTVTIAVLAVAAVVIASRS